MSLKINYTTLKENNPTLLGTKLNSFGQKVELFEHPFEGDEYPVIVAFPEYGVAFSSGFYDAEDMMQEGDYEPHLIAGEFKMGYELS